MLRYYKRFKDEEFEREVTHEEALRTLLKTYRDNDMTRDMLTVQNYIETRFSFIRVDDPENPLKPMPGLWNLLPDDAVYDEETGMRKGGKA